MIAKRKVMLAACALMVLGGQHGKRRPLQHALQGRGFRSDAWLHTGRTGGTGLSDIKQQTQ